MFLVLGVEVDVGYAAVLRLNNVLEMVDNNGSAYQTRQIVFTRSRSFLNRLEGC